MIKKLILSFTLIAAALSSEAQSNTAAQKPLPIGPPQKNAIFFADSVKISRSDIQLIPIDNIASFTVIENKDAIIKAGYNGEMPLAYLETKAFARKRYQSFLSSRSSEYASLLSNKSSEEGIIYILNEEVLGKSLERELAAINTESFIATKVVKGQDLPSKYKQGDPKFGVFITTKKL
ncbi:hypothetical protein [Pedobacter frigoris]|uniref:hypothetical protein n=1 Tax=Pedobacter frigoris TaxID=2571272 RepID=UPI00292F9574|nr:hypothetical protein [Pedobacter frigoris]